MKNIYIDLFAGCGGLSLGCKTAGFNLGFAVEKSDMAGETFYHNFIKHLTSEQEWEKYLLKKPIEQLKSKLFIDETVRLLENKELLNEMKGMFGEVSLIAGGPPCQGFSLAGKRNPKDHRNQLPWQFLEYVEIFKPKVVLMENVVGMRRRFNKHDEDAPFSQIKSLLESGFGENEDETKYVVQELELNAMHYGVPQHRPRVFLLGIRKDIADEKGLYASDEIWYSKDYYKGIIASPLCPKPIMEDGTFYKVQDAIADFLNDDLRSNAYLKALNEDSSFRKVINKNTSTLANNNERKHTEKVEARFRLYQYFSQNGVTNKIFNMAAKYNISKSTEEKSLLAKEIEKCKFPAVSNDGVVIAKTKDELFEVVLELSTKKHSQRPLNIEAPSPTVVSIADDVIHPVYPRIPTVREQARFQSFPDYFEFRSKETTGGIKRRTEVPQYTQVGNAVPPLMAKAIAEHIMGLIS